MVGIAHCLQMLAAGPARDMPLQSRVVRRGTEEPIADRADEEGDPALRKAAASV